MKYISISLLLFACTNGEEKTPLDTATEVTITPVDSWCEASWGGPAGTRSIAADFATFATVLYCVRIITYL